MRYFLCYASQMIKTLVANMCPKSGEVNFYTLLLGDSHIGIILWTVNLAIYSDFAIYSKI